MSPHETVSGLRFSTLETQPKGLLQQRVSGFGEARMQYEALARIQRGAHRRPVVLTRSGQPRDSAGVCEHATDLAQPPHPAALLASAQRWKAVVQGGMAQLHDAL